MTVARCPLCYQRLTTELAVHQAAECPTSRPRAVVTPRIPRPGASAPRGRGLSACGTRSGYNAGCRCRPCTDAATEYIRQRRQDPHQKALYALYRSRAKANAR